MVNYITRQCLWSVVNGQQNTHISRSILNSTRIIEVTLTEQIYFHQI